MGARATIDGKPTTPDEAKIDAILAPLDQCHKPGAAVAIAIGGVPVYRKGFGLASVELPALLRVDPGNPDNSYLVHKIEGRPAILGAQMPPNQPALSGPQITAIRTWIQNGANP